MLEPGVWWYSATPLAYHLIHIPSWQAIKHWLHEADKLQHILVSLVLMQMALFIMPFWPAALVVSVIGVAKEVWDHFYGSFFCWRDIYANTFGIILGWLLLLPFR